MSKKRSNGKLALRAHRDCAKRQASTSPNSTVFIKQRALAITTERGRAVIRVRIQPSPSRKNASKRPIFVRFLHVECSLSLQFNLFRAQQNEHPTDSSKELEGFIGSGESLTFGRALAWFVFVARMAAAIHDALPRERL